MQLIYEQLTPEEHAFICNGCGSKGGIINVPDFIFKEDCHEHDFEHYIGHTETHRKKSNRKYYKRMRVSISKREWYRKPLLHIVALTYYGAVVVGSKKAFNYGDKFKNRDDLHVEMIIDAIKKDKEELER